MIVIVSLTKTCRLFHWYTAVVQSILKCDKIEISCRFLWYATVVQGNSMYNRTEIYNCLYCFCFSNIQKTMWGNSVIRVSSHHILDFVTRMGLEPMTPTLKVLCSTNWASESSSFLSCWPDVWRLVRHRYLISGCKGNKKWRNGQINRCIFI